MRQAGPALRCNARDPDGDVFELTAKMPGHDAAMAPASTGTGAGEA